MLDSHIEPLQVILRESEQLGALSPFARLNYRYSTSDKGKEKDATSILVTAASQQGAEQLRRALAAKRRNDISLHVYPDLPQIPSFLSCVDDRTNNNILDDVDGKLHVLMFMNDVKENKQLLAQLNDLQELKIELHLCVFGIDIQKVRDQTNKNKWSKFRICRTGGQKQEKEMAKELGIDRFPYGLLFYNKRIVSKGALNIADIEKALQHLNKLNMFEAVNLISLPNLQGCEVWDSQQKRDVNVMLEGEVVLEFWDHTCEDVLHDKDQLIQNSQYLRGMRFIQVYAGSSKQTLKTGFRLKHLGLEHPTAKKLQIFELPCTFVLSGGRIIWKGNRQFANFPKVIENLKRNRPLEEASPIFKDAWKKLKETALKALNEVYAGDKANTPTIQFHAQTDVFCQARSAERYKSYIAANIANDRQKDLAIRLFNALEKKLPNLRCLFRHVESGVTGNQFTFRIPPPGQASNPNAQRSLNQSPSKGKVQDAKPAAKPEDPNTRILDKHVDPLQVILREGEQLGGLSPFARLNFHYCTSDNGKEKDASSILVTAASPQEEEKIRKSLAAKRRNDIALRVYQDLPQIPLTISVVDDKTNNNILDDVDGKLHVLMLLNDIKENKEVLAQLNQLEELKIDLHLCVFGMDMQKVKDKANKNKWSKFRLCRSGGQKQEKETARVLGIDRFPYAVFFYNKRIVSKGMLNVADIQKALQHLNKLNMFEAVNLMALPNLQGCEVWDSQQKRDVNVMLEGEVVLEFWDDTCQDVLHDKDQLIQGSKHLQRMRFIQVYAGSTKQTLKTGFRLKHLGLEHPTAKKLQIFELPCTFVLDNGRIIWKGNRQYHDFVKLVDNLKKNKAPDEPVPLYKDAWKKLKETTHKALTDVYASDKASAPQIHFHAQTDVFCQTRSAERYKAYIAANIANDRQKDLAIRLFNTLEKKLPNLRCLFRHVETGIMGNHITFRLPPPGQAPQQKQVPQKGSNISPTKEKPKEATKPGAKPTEPNTRILDKHVEPLQVILRESEQLGGLSPFARLNFRYCTSDKGKEKDATSILVTAASQQEEEKIRKSLAAKRRNDIALRVYQDLPQIPLTLSMVDDKTNNNILDDVDGKLHVLMILNQVKENKQLLAQLNQLEELKIELHLCVFGMDMEKVKKKANKNKWAKFRLCRSGGQKPEKAIATQFGIEKYPYGILFYNKRIVSKGVLNIGDIEKALQHLNKLNMFEAVNLIALPNLRGCEVWDSQQKKDVNVMLEGEVVLEFWDDTCQDVLHDKDQLIQGSKHLQRMRFVQVYAGSAKQTLKTGFRLKHLGLDHPTAKKLQIFELPCTFVIDNGRIIWKGNRQFVDFVKLIDNLKKNKAPDEPVPILRDAWKKLKETALKALTDVYSSDKASAPQINFHVQTDVFCQARSAERYKSYIAASISNDRQKDLAVRLFNTLEKKLPNLRCLFRHVETGVTGNQFTFRLPPPGQGSQQSLNKNQKISPERQRPSPQPMAHQSSYRNEAKYGFDLGGQLLGMSNELSNETDHGRRVDLLNRSLQNQEELNRQLQYQVKDYDRISEVVKDQRQALSEKDALIAKLRAKLADYKDTPVEKLHSRVNELLSDKIRLEALVAESDKKLKEQTAKANRLKIDVESSEVLLEKRESQLNILIGKVKAQEHEIMTLKSEVKKKQAALSTLESELKGLRPYQDADEVILKQSDNLQDLHKQIIAKNHEISMLKEVISKWKHDSRSPEPYSTKSQHKLPSVRGASSLANSVEGGSTRSWSKKLEKKGYNSSSHHSDYAIEDFTSPKMHSKGKKYAKPIVHDEYEEYESASFRESKKAKYKDVPEDYNLHPSIRSEYVKGHAKYDEYERRAAYEEEKERHAEYERMKKEHQRYPSDNSEYEYRKKHEYQEEHERHPSKHNTYDSERYERERKPERHDSYGREESYERRYEKRNESLERDQRHDTIHKGDKYDIDREERHEREKGERHETVQKKHDTQAKGDKKIQSNAELKGVESSKKGEAKQQIKPEEKKGKKQEDAKGKHEEKKGSQAKLDPKKDAKKYSDSDSDSDRGRKGRDKRSSSRSSSEDKKVKHRSSSSSRSRSNSNNKKNKGKSVQPPAPAQPAKGATGKAAVPAKKR
ncbi:unnamed protein product [Blepharisma stoltei]|uniref:Uncharacterized protein n=1 Tax=Blepharisma stoltei TaxID=1481888 RepID=A0AAU9JFZ0_9CILI|nr:unnamed protein product [Blepharisma stoltei]